MRKKNIMSLVRSNVREMKEYRCARYENSDKDTCLMDANENSMSSCFGSEYYKYPDPLQKDLRKRISEYIGVSSGNIICGNGSDELIDLLIRIFCEPEKDSVLLFTPGYGMYRTLCEFNSVNIEEVSFDSGGEIDPDRVIQRIKENKNIKLIFIISPNNPTGLSVKKEVIKKIALVFDGILVVDEAYAEFSEDKSSVSLTGNNSNVMVLRTFSKALGMAGLRLGYIAGNESIINQIIKVKFPYNVNAYTQENACRAFDFSLLTVDRIRKERDFVYNELRKISEFIEPFRSDANFIFFKALRAEELWDFLKEQKVLIRNINTFSTEFNGLRVTVGKEDENRRFLKLVNEFYFKDKSVYKYDSPDFEDVLSEETSGFESFRKTSETSVYIKSQDSADYSIDTGIKFFDHMLEQFALNSGIGFILKAMGDFDPDLHHTIEDCAIMTGRMVRKLFKDKKRRARYGFVLPMDEALAFTALDFSQRPYLKWDVKFNDLIVAGIETNLLKHFFSTFSYEAGICIHVRCRGENDHHTAEALFKSLGRAVKSAFKEENYGFEIPSTKGVL